MGQEPQTSVEDWTFDLSKKPRDVELAKRTKMEDDVGGCPLEARSLRIIPRTLLTNVAFFTKGVVLRWGDTGIPLPSGGLEREGRAAAPKFLSPFVLFFCVGFFGN